VLRFADNSVIKRHSQEQPQQQKWMIDERMYDERQIRPELALALDQMSMKTGTM